MADQQQQHHRSEEPSVRSGEAGRSNTARTGAARAEKAGQTEEASNATEQIIPVIRHVGPTIESDPGYMSVVGSGEATPEARIAADALTEEPGVIVTEGLDPVSGRQMVPGRPETLKTRLPGDTSSDPHTDLGPDNATSVQRRGEKKNAA